MGLDEEPARRMGRVTPWTTGRGGLDVPQAGGVLDRRGFLVLGCSSQLLLLRLDVSDVGPVERVAVRARITPSTSVDLPALRRSGAEKAAGSLRADVPGSRTHPAPPLVASCRCSVCSRCCSQPSRAPCTGGRAPASGAFAAAALLLRRSWHGSCARPTPCSTRASSGYLRSRTGSATITIIFFVATRDDGPAQVTVMSQDDLFTALPRQRHAALVPGTLGHVLAVPFDCRSSGWGSAARSALSSRPMTRSLVSGKRCP